MHSNLRLAISRLPDRLQRRFATERAERQLERAFAAFMETWPPIDQGLSETGTKVGVATFGSGTWHLVLEVLLAHALALRGASPELLLCDLPALPACDERTSLLRDPSRCHGCLPAKRAILDRCRIPWRGMSAFVDDGVQRRARAIVDALRAEEIEDYSHGGWPIGRWIYVSVCHFLRGDARGSGPQTIAVRRLYLTSAIVAVEAVRRWLDEVRPDIVIAESGAHIMWRVAFELARARGIRVVCREIGKGGWDSHIYSLNAECMFPNLTDAWAQARNVPLSAQQSERVDTYLRTLPAKTYESTRKQTRDESRDSTEDADGLRRQLGFGRDRKVAVLFTGVTWDLATAGRDVAFDGMYDWIAETLRLAANLPDVQFVIRAHPAETSVLTREHALDRIKEQWPQLPSNVSTIAPGTPIPVRRLCEMADLVLTYCSTTGIEAAIYEKPVMVSGAPHYRGRGFTIDIRSRPEYATAIQQWAAGALHHSAQEASEAARRYFYLFFLRYHIDMGWTTSPLEPPYRLTIKDRSELLPGRNPAVDAVCSGILDGHEIITNH